LLFALFVVRWLGFYASSTNVIFGRSKRVLIVLRHISGHMRYAPT